MLVVDYYSRYIVVEELKDSLDKLAVVAKLEGIFMLLGIPNSIVSDNGPQFISERFKKFLAKWDIQHVTSSPKYPQSNGEAERAVRTVKGLMDKNVSLQAALCLYRDTPLANGYSPAQLLFNRSLNSMGLLTCKAIDLQKLQSFEARQRENQALNYNRRHAVKAHQPMEAGQKVVIRNPDGSRVPGEVIGVQGRELAIGGPGKRVLRRNRALVSGRDDSPDMPAALESPQVSAPSTSAIASTPDSESDSTSHETTSAEQLSSSLAMGPPSDVSRQNRQSSPVAARIQRSRASGNRVSQRLSSPVVTKTRSGRISKAPKRLDM